MHGQIRAPELPIYGAKTLAVRNGTLDLHGRPVDITWTILAETATAGSSQLVVPVPLDWQVGDEILVATTGGHKSQDETETFFLAGVSVDSGTGQTTLTLDGTLQYDHLGITETYDDGTVLELRAEVGLLTHNIVFQGAPEVENTEQLPPCPEGMEPTQFAEQTCLSGRAGDELGGDDFGGCIMFHNPEMDSGAVVAHIEFAEIRNVGQAFRLGRYPVHFHMNGKMGGSYVRGSSVRQTYNRAINIHNSHDLMIEHNVIYDVMGGAVFLEDSIEQNNTLQYNLLAWVHATSSLLNDDITPAAFWITHPFNTLRHNHIAGGTDFAIWYRMLSILKAPPMTLTSAPGLPLCRSSSTTQLILMACMASGYMKNTSQQLTVLAALKILSLQYSVR